MPQDNVDPEELAKFARLAHEWWDTKGPLKTLHDINPLRFTFIQQYVDLRHKRVLDIGCGGGILTEALAKAGASVTGIDGEASVIAAAQYHASLQSLTIDYHCSLAEDFAIQHPATFDVITCMELLEHVPNPPDIIKSCHTLLKPQGKLFLSTINRTLKAYTLVILGAEYLLKLLPKHTHTYNKFIRPSELAAWLRHHELSVTEMTGVKYNPLLRQATFTQDVEINYLIMSEKS